MVCSTLRFVIHVVFVVLSFHYEENVKDCETKEIVTQFIIFFVEGILVQLLPIMIVLRIYNVEEFDTHLTDSLIITQQESEAAAKLKDSEASQGSTK
jgi:RsiW-degrading membrane proteinase PrsW (M82 family)